MAPFDGNEFEFDFESRIVSTEYDDNQDGSVEPSLRPKTLDEYIGQKTAKENDKRRKRPCNQSGNSKSCFHK